jgi:hypothetical protein
MDFTIMALFTYSNIVTQIEGKIGNIIFENSSPSTLLGSESSHLRSSRSGSLAIPRSFREKRFDTNYGRTLNALSTVGNTGKVYRVNGLSHIYTRGRFGYNRFNLHYP